uniref:Post-GPI attachment to proteins factor 2 n=1 Tax=Globodera rostochiensis TaxID=31243 RepID=A0A914HWV8_GLORO
MASAREAPAINKARRSGRIILELGGYITEQEARSILMHLYLHLPFPVEFVSQELFEKRRELETKVRESNRNKFDWETIIKYNMQNCKSWLTPYDTFYGPSVMQIFGEEELLSVQFKYLVFFIAGCPLGAFLLCLFLSIILHYEQAVWTHCEVTNWLPSLSSAVSSFAPERYIWRLFIGFHGTPRLVLAFAFKNFLITSSLWPSPFRPWYRWASQFSCALNLCEILSLVLLSSISSTEDHFLHALSFCGFALFAHFYMFISIWLFDFSGRRRSSKLGELSFQYKVLCCVGSVLSLVFALYFYYRHNRYCESGVYTLFALSEYSLILFNILFHSTLYYDFHSRTLTLNTAALTSAGGYDLLPMYTTGAVSAPTGVPPTAVMTKVVMRVLQQQFAVSSSMPIHFLLFVLLHNVPPRIVGSVAKRDASNGQEIGEGHRRPEEEEGEHLRELSPWERSFIGHSDGH